MSAAVRRALDEQWPRVYEAARTQISVIEEFAVAGAAGTTAQRRDAVQAAHQLSGRLGMFTRADAALPPASLLELRRLVDRLDGSISLDDHTT